MQLEAVHVEENSATAPKFFLAQWREPPDDEKEKAVVFRQWRAEIGKLYIDGVAAMVAPRLGSVRLPSAAPLQRHSRPAPQVLAPLLGQPASRCGPPRLDHAALRPGQAQRDRAASVCCASAAAADASAAFPAGEPSASPSRGGWVVAVLGLR